MNKVTIINLNGKAYQLEEAGFEALQAYLQEARIKLDGNPDQSEIMKDFEQAIAEKCDKYLTTHKNVVTAQEIKTIITDMGPVAVESDTATDATADTTHVVKRLYRIREGAWIAGVCTGIALYFGIDVMVVRALFIVFSFFTKGGGIGLYILMAFFVPSADTNEEKAFARGKEFNAHEFMEEMKLKYGKYAEEKYWKKYTYTKKEYGRKVAQGWVGLTRVGTGIVAVIGGIIITAISIAYSVLLWSVIFHGAIFNTPLTAGMSPLLLGIVLTAATYVIVWPIKKMVQEARNHTWNIEKKKHPLKQIVSIAVWIIAIGFATSIATLSAHDKNTVPYGTDFWIAHHEFCIGGNYFCNPDQSPEHKNEAAVRDTVQQFGTTLQQVSLLAPNNLLKTEMATMYGPYVTPELLKQWQDHPAAAPGREVSSPYPDHIDIATVIKNPDGSYTVTGSIVEMIQGGKAYGLQVVAHQPITLTLINTDAGWRISAAIKGAETN